MLVVCFTMAAACVSSANADEEIRALLEKRAETTGKLVEWAQAANRNGTISSLELIGVIVQDQRASLELAETREERIAILEKVVDLLRQSEEIAELRSNPPPRPGQNNQFAGIGELLQAQAALLQAQIDLARETRAH
ncbi:MAG: hypothetical protein ACI8UO_001852 [Verrucomicrobiales bacterium]|jgi:hypothetical protein